MNRGSRSVESRMGAVAWAMRQRSLSHPRSSNRTCGFPASGSPTGFIVRHTKQITDRKRHLRREFVLRLTIQLSLKDPDDSRCLQAHRQSPSPCLLRKHTRSQGPFLRRRYPASTVVRPCPTPANAAARSDVEAATLAPNGSPPITRTTFPTCRAHYPGGSSGCACRLLPRSRGLPQMAGGSASALSLSRCYGAIRQKRYILGAGQESKERSHGKSERSQPIPRGV